MEAGHYAKGIADFGEIIKTFPSALTNCKNMDGDIAAIESWATIFEEPEKLAKQLGKNYLLHHKTIHDDFTKEKKAWASAAYFDAGVDTALMMTELIGPIVTTEEIFS